MFLKTTLKIIKKSFIFSEKYILNLLRKKFVLIISLVSLINIQLFSQSIELTIDQAVEYLENVLNSNLRDQPNIYGGEKSINIEVCENELYISYFWKGCKDVIKFEYENTDIDCTRISFEISDISNIFLKKAGKKYAVAIECLDGTKNCFLVEEDAIKYYAQEFVDRPDAINHYNYIHLFYLDNQVDQKRAFNALQYIIFKLADDREKIKLVDPFVKYGNNIEVVSLTNYEGVVTLTVNFSGAYVKTILDSGASDVSIPKYFFDELLYLGVINQNDILTPGLYKIADGSIVENKRFLIPYIGLNDNIKVENVVCSVNQSNDIFLLGKSFLDRFKVWKIDNEKNQLIIEP